MHSSGRQWWPDDKTSVSEQGCYILWQQRLKVCLLLLLLFFKYRAESSSKLYDIYQRQNNSLTEFGKVSKFLQLLKNYFH